MTRTSAASRSASLTLTRACDAIGNAQELDVSGAVSKRNYVYNRNKPEPAAFLVDLIYTTHRPKTLVGGPLCEFLHGLVVHNAANSALNKLAAAAATTA